MSGEYYIYRNGAFIGQKQVLLNEDILGIKLEIQVYFADAERKIDAYYGKEKNLLSFCIEELIGGYRTVIDYKIGESENIRINNDVIIDEVFFACCPKILRDEHMYDVLNTNDNSFYKLRLFKKTKNKYNILVPTYAYLEYDDDGLLGYMEDFIEGIQIMRQ